MRQNHDGVRSHEGAVVFEAVVDARVPRLQGIGEPEGEVSEGDDDVHPNLFPAG